MRLIKRTNLEQAVRRHPAAIQAVVNWVAMVRAASWENPSQLVETVTMRARPIANGRVIFDIKGNEYRLVCAVKYAAPDDGFPGVFYFKFFGTHAEYDRIDPETVEYRG